VSTVPETTLQDLVDELAASRHAGGYRFKVPERVLRQFAGYCRREGYPDGSITQEAVNGFLYGRHLRASTIRRNELAKRQLAGHAQAVGWDASATSSPPRPGTNGEPAPRAAA
jgi:integrase/recombinase XerD